MNVTPREPVWTPTATSGQQRHCSHPNGSIPTDQPGNTRTQAPPVCTDKPAQPLRWHEAFCRVPELRRVLWETTDKLPTPHHLARAYRDCFGRSPYGGWPGQRYLYDLPDVIELTRWLQERQAAAVTVRFRRGPGR